MNLLECTKVITFFKFTKQNAEIFKKKLFIFVNGSFLYRIPSSGACSWPYAATLIWLTNTPVRGFRS